MKWLLLVLLFEGAEVVDSKVGHAATEADCKTAQERIAEKVKDSPYDVWSICVEMTHKPRKVDVKPDRVN